MSTPDDQKVFKRRFRLDIRKYAYGIGDRLTDLAGTRSVCTLR